MANYIYNNNKDKEPLSLVEQIAQKNPSDLVINQPTNRGVAELHSTTPGAPEGFEGSSTSVYTHNDSQKNVKDEMNANSKLWWEAKAAGDTDWMKSLEEANRQLAGLLGEGVTYDPGSGTWSGAADVPATMKASMTTGVDPQLPSYDYDAWMKENPAPTYQSAYNERIDALMNELLGREKFSYNAESDPLFQQYKNIYTREGNRSMNDTLAAAASGAGGMSSYAMTAAQQANNYYMAQLGDKIPELQQLAYSMYLDDLNLQRQDISMLQNRDSYEYGQYRDSMNDWFNNRDFGYGMYRDQMGDYQWGTELNYDAYRDQVADDRYKTEWEHSLEREAIEDAWRNKEWDYGVSRDQIEDAWRQTEWDYGVNRDQIEDAFRNKQFNYGVSQDEIDNAFREKQFNYGVSQDQLANEWKQKQWDYETSLDDDIPEDDPDSSSKFWGSINSLGLGPVNASFVLELAEYGGIVENADGTVKWASGWNANNYKEKLKQAQGNSPFDFMPGF